MQKIPAFLLLFSSWLLLSGHWVPWMILLGLISTVVVTVLAGRMSLLGHKSHSLRFYLNLLLYLPWLIAQILVANCQVAWHILSSQENLSPKFVRLRTSQKDTLAQTALANSITLTSGTLVCDIDAENFEVHFMNCSPESVASLDQFDQRTTSL